MDISGDIQDLMPVFKQFDNLPPCPKCGSEVEFSTSRDLNILQSAIWCTAEAHKCDLIVFHTENIFNLELTSIDYLTTVMKYCQWAATKPERYCGDTWTHYTKK